MATDLKGLNNFREKLEKRKKLYSNFNSSFVKDIAKRGEQIAKEEYVGVKDVNVNHEQIDKNTGRVTVEKKGIAYIEFGTGRVGQGSGYDADYLPKSGVPITGGWQYYYPSEHKDTKDGVEGWYAGDRFMKGIPSGQQMYRTSQRLKMEMVNIVKNKIKGDGTSV